MEYEEMVRLINEGANRNAKTLKCLDPYIREILHLDKETISFSEFTLVKTALKSNTYQFRVNVSVKEES